MTFLMISLAKSSSPEPCVGLNSSLEGSKDLDRFLSVASQLIWVSTHMWYADALLKFSGTFRMFEKNSLIECDTLGERCIFACLVKAARLNMQRGHCIACCYSIVHLTYKERCISLWKAIRRKHAIKIKHDAKLLFNAKRDSTVISGSAHTGLVRICTERVVPRTYAWCTQWDCQSSVQMLMRGTWQPIAQCRHDMYLVWCWESKHIDHARNVRWWPCLYP